MRGVLRICLQKVCGIASLLLILTPPVFDFADYMINPDGNIDYYEYKSIEDIGLVIPQQYQATPSLTTIRDMLVSAKIMEEKPYEPPVQAVPGMSKTSMIATIIVFLLVAFYKLQKTKRCV